MSDIFTPATADIKAPSDLNKLYFTPMQAPQDDQSVPVYLDRELRKIGQAISELAQDTISVDDIKLLIAEGLASIIFPETPEGEEPEFPFDYDELFRKIWDDIINNPLYDDLFQEIVREIIDPDNLNEFFDIIYDNFVLNNRTFWQPTAPVSTDLYELRVNDTWINSSQGNIVFVWDGSQWLPANDVRISEQGIAIQAILTMDNDLLNETAFYQQITNVTAYAGVTSRVFYQNEEPPNPYPDETQENGEYILKEGDQWFDTDYDTSNDTVLGGTPAHYVYQNGWKSATDVRITGSWGAITEVETAIANPTTAFAQTIKQIKADVVTADSKAQAAITELNQTFSDGTSAMALSIRDLQANTDGSLGELDAAVTNIEQAQIGVCYIGGSPSDQTNKSACQAAGGTWQVGIPFASSVKQVTINDGNGIGTIEQKFQVHKTDIDNAERDAADAYNLGYQAFLDANSAQETADDAKADAGTALEDLIDVNSDLSDIFAQYTIKIDVNGKVAGFGLMNDGATSAFIVNANKFAIADQVTQNQVIPFAVVDNVVYIDTAVIRNLSIGNSKIQEGQIGNSVLSVHNTTYTVAKNSGNQYTPGTSSATFGGCAHLTISGWLISEDGDGLGGGDGRITLAMQWARNASGVGTYSDIQTVEKTGIRTGGGDTRYDMPFLFRYSVPDAALGGWNFVSCRLRMAGSTTNGCTVKRVAESITTMYKGT